MGYGITRKPKNMGQAIRFFCLECVGSYDEYKDVRGKTIPSYMANGTVNECPDLNCHLRPYRFGKRPSKPGKNTEIVLEAPALATKPPRTARKASGVLGMGSSLF
jgi:hypothetical protein